MRAQVRPRSRPSSIAPARVRGFGGLYLAPLKVGEVLAVDEFKGHRPPGGDPGLVRQVGEGPLKLQGDSENLSVRRTAGHHYPVESSAVSIVIEVGVLLDETALQLNRQVLVDLHDFLVAR